MMNFSKFSFHEAGSSANLRNTVSAIDMGDCALYNLGLGLSKTIVDGSGSQTYLLPPFCCQHVRILTFLAG